MLEVLMAISLIVKQLDALSALAAKLQSENRDPTPEELADVKAKRQAANEAADSAGI